MADPPIAVRPATAEDLLALVRIYQGSPDLLPDQLSDAQRAMWDRMMGTPALTVFVAEWAGEPVGTAVLLVMPNLTYDCRPTAFIEAVVVVPSHRRRGIATAIMRRVLDDAGAQSCRKVQLLSHKRHADDGAHELYRSLGFDPEAEGFRLYLG